MTTCPWCGQTEPSDWLLRNNHWVRLPGETGYNWCEANDMCIAMSLTRSHVESYARRGSGDDRLACLERAIERAEQLWAKKGTDWLEPYRRLLRPITAPEHHTVPESVDVDLFGGAA